MPWQYEKKNGVVMIYTLRRGMPLELQVATKWRKTFYAGKISLITGIFLFVVLCVGVQVFNIDFPLRFIVLFTACVTLVIEVE